MKLTITLGTRREIAYNAFMDSDRDDIPRDPPQEWVDALERGRADIAAGLTAPWSEVRVRLLARIADAEAAQARRRA